MAEVSGRPGAVYIDLPAEIVNASGNSSLINVAMDPGAARRPQEFGWLDRQGRRRWDRQTGGRGR
jgi:hypothetical protein